MIRAGRKSDIPEIQMIRKAAGLFDYGFLYSSFVKQNLVFIREFGDRIVGYVIVFPLLFKRGFCLQIGVSTEYQGQGIGTDLMLFIEKYMHNTYGTYRLFAHTIKNSSLTYFAKKLSYRSWFSLLGLTIIYKDIN